MKVLITATSSPTGVGIAYEDGDISAFSGCCGEWLFFDWIEDCWLCKECREGRFSCEEGTSLWQAIETKYTDPSYGLHRWISNWTGIPEEQITVSIT